MNRCSYKLPPSVTLWILNTCFESLTNWSEVDGAAGKCCVRLPAYFWLYQLIKHQSKPPSLKKTILIYAYLLRKLVYLKCVKLCFCFVWFPAREMTRGKFLNILERPKKWQVFVSSDKEFGTLRWLWLISYEHVQSFPTKFKDCAFNPETGVKCSHTAESYSSVQLLSSRYVKGLLFCQPTFICVSYLFLLLF